MKFPHRAVKQVEKVKITPQKRPVDASPTISGEVPTGPTSPPEPAFPRRVETKRPDRPNTLTLRMEDSGFPLWGKLSDRTRELWKEVLNHPETVKHFGAVAEKAEKPVVPIVSVETVASCLDIFGAVQGRFFAWRYKIPVDAAEQIFAYNETEKALIVPPAQRVLAKYGPDFLARYGDEITLGFLLANSARVKIMVCAAVAAKMRAEAERKKKASAEPGTSEAVPVDTKEVFERRPVQ